MFELRSQLLSGAILLEADVKNVPQLTGVYFYFKLYHIILFNQQRSQDMDNFGDHFLLIKIQFFFINQQIWQDYETSKMFDLFRKIRLCVPILPSIKLQSY